MYHLKSFHFIFGIALLITFALTGQYMHHKYDHLEGMPSLERALFRAEHIYILLMALINVGLGTYLTTFKAKILKLLQNIGSFLVTIASVLMVYSFFTELPSTVIERPISRNALYLILAGVLFHAFTQLIKKHIENK